MVKFVQYSWRVAVVTLALLCFFQTSVLAGIYKWRDDSGKLHFTDDRSKIPLKYQQDMKKFKGAPPPPATAKEEAAEEQSGEQTEATMSPGPGTEAAAEQEADPKPTFTPEEQALLKETHGILMKIRKGKINFVNSAEPTKANGDRYVKVAHSGGKLKKMMAKKIGKSKVPSLMEAKAYMKKSASRDRLAKTGGGERRIKKLKKRFEMEIPKEKEIIEMLRADLGIKGPPLISLKDLRQKMAEAAKEKSKSQAPVTGGGSPL